MQNLLPPSCLTPGSNDRSQMRSGLPKPMLERLPEEIRQLLLRSLPSSSALQALVRASPSYHASYLCQRQLILSCVLQNELVPACLVAAHAVEEASKFLGQDYEVVRLARVSLIQRFLVQRSTPLVGERLYQTCLETTISIFQRHRRICQLASQYLAEKLSVNLVSGEAVQSDGPPSREEVHRLCRALYHFELYCLLFVSNRVSEDGPYRKQRVGLSGGEYGLSQRFLPNLGKWEVEEIACIREYLFDCYTRIWHNCARELARLRDCYIQVKENPYPENPAQWEAPFEDQKKEYWMSLGLEFFRRISQAQGVETQARMLLENPWRREHFLSRALKGQCQGPGRVCAAHPFAFNHQASEREDTNTGPWLGISDFGLVGQGKDCLRGWGYVIWDGQRIDSWKTVAAKAEEGFHRLEES